MKKMYTILSVLLMATAPALFGQDTINTFHERSNVASRVIHGNCFKIHSVSVTGNDSSRSEFQSSFSNFPQTGWLISTGYATSIDHAPSVLLSRNVDTATTGADTLLTELMIADNFTQQNEQSYDATRASWVVESFEDDTLEFHYVFATEEFPEWAPPVLAGGPANNDFPAILYRVQGTTSYAFASVVPGTVTPVTLQSVNPVNNPQYFIETPATDSFAFNGRTVKMTARIPVRGGVLNEIVLLIGDGGVPEYDSGIFLETIEDSASAFDGYITDAGKADQVVTLYHVRSGMYDADASTTTDQSGYFELFPGVSDTFLIQVAGTPVFSPGYFPGTWNWETASEVDLLDPLCTAYSFKRDSLAVQSGTCAFSGKLFNWSGPFQPRDPQPAVTGLEDVRVLLVDTLTNQVAAWATTNAQGVYSFSNLAAGTYRIYPDVPGLKVNTAHLVTAATCGNTSLDYAQFGNVFGATTLRLDNPLIDAGPQVEWVNGYSVFNVPGFARSTTTRMKVLRDTLFHDTLYHALYAYPVFEEGVQFNAAQARYVGAFREQGRKVYARFRSGIQTYLPRNKELLYFDGNLETGDLFRSFAMYNGSTENDSLEILNRDTFTVNGREHTRWTFIRKGPVTPGDPEEEFVTGPGNSTGLLNLGINNFPILNSEDSYMICYTNPTGVQLDLEDFFETSVITETSCFNTVSAGEMPLRNMVKVMPNPGSETFTIDCTGLIPQKGVGYSVRDIQGRIVASGHTYSESIQIATSEWNAGAYFIQLIPTEQAPVSTVWIKQ